MHWVDADPVGLPALAALAVGVFAFLAVVLLARARGGRAPKSADARRRNASIPWIVVQGLGIGIAGLGPLRVVRDPVSGVALGEATIVLALMLVAVWLFHAASRTMGRNWALVARTRKDGTLVQSGPFAYVRNPIYVALACFMIALAIACGHLANLIFATPVFATGTWMRVLHEERVLRATFGEAFDSYAARVKRFVPGVL